MKLPPFETSALPRSAISPDIFAQQKAQSKHTQMSMSPTFSKWSGNETNKKNNYMNIGSSLSSSINNPPPKIPIMSQGFNVRNAENGKKNNNNNNNNNNNDAAWNKTFPTSGFPTPGLGFPIPPDPLKNSNINPNQQSWLPGAMALLQEIEKKKMNNNKSLFLGFSKTVLPKIPNKETKDPITEQQKTSIPPYLQTMQPKRGNPIQPPTEWTNKTQYESRLHRATRAAEDIAQKNLPPESVTLPYIGTLSEYCSLLRISQKEAIQALSNLNIQEHFLIPQNIGEMLTRHIHPNTIIELQKSVDDLIPKFGNYIVEEYSTFPKRTPVICILGHVDHGKTTFLDYMRKTRVAEKEAGGITQSIGAFTVNMPSGSANPQCVIFDTPGHAAFGNMRKRGARVVDLAILMVDACEGVQPQTKESLAIIHKEKLPFIVALNKCDRPQAEPQRVRKQLEELGVNPQQIEIAEISAKTGQGIPHLLELLDFVCEMEDCRGNIKATAEIVVLESKRSARDGSIVHALVQDGTLRHGDYVFTRDGLEPIRITRLQNETQTSIENAGPSTPVTFLGGKDLIESGTILIAAKDKAEAMAISEMRKARKSCEAKSAFERRSYEEKLGRESFAKKKIKKQWWREKKDATSSTKSGRGSDDPRALKLWIRAETWGGIEAIEKYLQGLKIPNETFHFEIIHKDIGPITEELLRETDFKNCFILGFNATVEKSAYVPKYSRTFNQDVIFHIFKDFVEHLEEILPPGQDIVSCGHAVVQRTFAMKPKKGEEETKALVAGILVQKGKLVADGQFRVKRDGKVIYEQFGATELRHFSSQVQEIQGGDECGLRLDFSEWKEKDIVECLEVRYEKKKIGLPLFELDAELQTSLPQPKVDDYCANEEKEML